jgi:hypothetical protein
MKKSILSFVVALTGTISSFSQGTVTFVNAPAAFNTVADRYIYLDGQTPLKGTNFKVQLYAGTSAAGVAAQTDPVDNTPSNMRGLTTTLPGVWTGGPSEKIIPAPYGTKDSDVWLQVRVWDINAGATYEAAKNGSSAFASGVSNPFLYHIPKDGSAASAYAMENFRAFVLVPEPSVFAFIGLSVVGLIMSRRQR